MLTHAGLLESRQFNLSVPEAELDVQAAWTVWKEHESRSRYKPSSETMLSKKLTRRIYAG